MVPRPSAAAHAPLSVPSCAAQAAGSARSDATPPLGGVAPTITWSWLVAMSVPMPASMPPMSAGETARNQRPSLKPAAASCTTPESKTAQPSAARPQPSTMAQTETMSPAAGPLTCSGEPANAPTTIPPMMPLTIPSAGGAPEAMATPRHNGRATRKTTSEAPISRRSGLLTDSD